jgi:hypothetical protein
VTSWEFTRGLSSVSAWAAGEYDPLAHLACASAWPWVEEVQLFGLTLSHLAGLAASPHLAGLSSLNLRNNDVYDGGARALARSPHLGNLRSLVLDCTGLGDEGARALASSPYLARLHFLGLAHNAIGDEGAKALADSPHLASLARLGLGNNPLSEEGRRRLRESLGRRAQLSPSGRPRGGEP